jgi:dTDP-glucose 4,6-dehydratase
LKVLVTGGAGFIGSNFIKYLVSHAQNQVSEIRILDKLTYSGNINNLCDVERDSYIFFESDICNDDTNLKASKGVDVIFNFAAESHVDRSISSDRVFYETNVVGTSSLLNAAAINNVSVFVQISTDEVYGSIDKGSWKESFPLSPSSPYAASKAAADLVTLSFHKTHGLDVRITRCSNNYGRNQHPEKIIPKFITNLMQGKKVPLYGEGHNLREWLHVQDHCEGVWLTLKSGEPGQVYNIGGGKELSNFDLTNVILNEFGLGEEMISRVSDRKGHDFRYSLNYEKSKQVLNFSPRINFEWGIKDTILWYRENRSWWEQLLKN